MPPKKNTASSPAYALEKEAVRDEIEQGLRIGVAALTGREGSKKKPDNFHNTKYLLRQYRRVEYAVNLSEADLNLRMEMEHGTKMSTLELNAELAGIDLSNTKLESYTRTIIRSRKMLSIIQSALDAVRSDPDLGEMLYQILYLTYFRPQKPKNGEEIIRELDRLGYPMSPSTYYRHLDTAIRAIDRILWGYTARDCIAIIKQFLPD